MHSIDGLAASGNAPKIFLKTTGNGLPWVAVVFCASFSLLAFMAVSSGAGQVFNWLSNMSAIAGLMAWFAISVTYIRFYKGLQVQGIDRKTLPYTTRFQPYAAWYGACSTLFVCFVRQFLISNSTPRLTDVLQFSGWSVFLKGNWSTANFVTNYLVLAIWPIMYIGARIYYGVKPVAAEDMDFKSDLAQIEADTFDEPPPRNKWEAFWQWLVRKLATLLDVEHH